MTRQKQNNQQNQKQNQNQNNQNNEGQFKKGSQRAKDAGRKGGKSSS